MNRRNMIVGAAAVVVAPSVPFGAQMPRYKQVYYFGSYVAFSDPPPVLLRWSQDQGRSWDSVGRL